MSDEIPTQLHLSAEASELTRYGFRSPLADMRRVKLVEQVSRKPLSHLWTSDYVNGTSAWVEFIQEHRHNAQARRYPERCYWHVLTPGPVFRYVRVRRIEDYDDLAKMAGVQADEALPTRWLTTQGAALRIEEAAIEPLRRRGIDYDVPCTAWFEFRFLEIQTVRTPELPLGVTA